MSRFCSKSLLAYAVALKSCLSSPLNTCTVARYSVGAGMQGGKEVIDGMTISYVRAGTGPKTVLCLPGALGSAWTDFKPQLEQLDKSKFTIIAWDPPGYGFSRPPDRDFMGDFFHRDADTALKLMKVLKLPKFSMLGWSDGGITAIILAAKYPLHIQKCVIWGANAYVLDEEIEMYKKIRDISTWSEKMRAPLVKMYGEEYFRKTWEDWVDAFIRIHNQGGDICTKEAKLIQCPLFVLHGDMDPMVARAHPLFFLSEVQNCRTYNFPDGKHNIHLRYPEEFNKLVSEFLLTYVPGNQFQRIRGEPR
ncbi:hypothetical protein ONE63_004607 [Megalurothrips usitatus]|uniref:AB hydrolase-1 domain-containing protein n=1 Tax=Megalurothrips usitatus TaxID=439358 RepID=A0AAV7X4F6_9NEOP|nr:hypothetical protein ONE63_004607 [Megalurothrips usitatus]